MAGRIIKRGERTWLIRVFLGRDANGKRLDHNHTIHGTKKDAQTYLNGVLRDRDLGTFANPSKVTVDALLDGLLADYKNNNKSSDWSDLVVRVHLRPFFGGMKATQVGTDELQAYVDARRKPRKRLLAGGKKTRVVPPASNGTINRELSLLRRAFNLAKRSNPPKVTVVPNVPKLAENPPRKGFFEHDAFVAIRRELPEEIKPVVTFAYFTGCRKGEILALQWSQVDLTERVVKLDPGTTKNDEGRTIFLTAELYEVLSIQKELRDEYFPSCPWVFSRGGERIRHFKGSWTSACKRAGLLTLDGKADKLFHDLRRTGVRNLIRAGVPERVAMMISGHRTRAIFDRYNIVSESDLRDAARKLGDYLTEKATEEAQRTVGAHASKEPLQ